jgi:phosphonate transport system permease protein
MTNAINTNYQSFKFNQRIRRIIKFGIILGLITFGYWTIIFLDIPIKRMLDMFGPLATMLAERVFPPDLEYASSWKVFISVIETVEMSILGAFYGTLITIPLAWCAAWNITPSREILYPLSRSIIVLCRSLPTLMLGLLLVSLFVFGPFAGILALAIGTIGFAGKLMAEQCEAIDMGPVDAISATGASPLKIFIYAVLPQVKSEWTGIIIYNWDARLRGSTILGFVGAGGIGLHLRHQISILEYHATLGIICIIVILVLFSETLSHFCRKWAR